MKKTFLGVLFAGMLLTSCSSEEPTTSPNENTEGGTSSYVTLSIVSNNAPGTRAEGDVTSEDPDADFENGAGDESTIHNVVLFFFDENGNALNVNMGGNNTSYKVIDGISPTDNNEHISGTGTDAATNPDQHNVEKWFTKTIQLHTKGVSKVKVLAIVNANVKTKDGEKVVYDYLDKNPITATPTLAGLSAAIFTGDYAHLPNYFVMSSSVYSNNGAVQREVLVNAYETAEKSKTDVATIYVERVKARVKVTDKTGITDHMYTPEINSNLLPADYKDKASSLTVKVLGWNLNTTCVRANYFKQLQPSYTYTWIWNDPSLHRSYWEEPVEMLKTVDANFNTAFKPSDITWPSETAQYKYCNPNTTTTTPTKVLVYTQLLDGTTPVSIASWYGVNYKFADLKTAVLEAQKTQALQLYVPAPSKVEGEFVNIDESYIDFEQGNGLTEDSKSWRAYPVLKKKDASGADIVYYTKDDSTGIGDVNQYNNITYDEAMVKMGFWNNTTEKKHQLEGAKIWKDGYAYYFVDIDHLGGINALVRNHSYNVEIQGFKGLGTPIYEPGNVIPEPDLPEDDKESHISVKMNVHSWRLIPKQSVTFGE